MRWPNLFIPGAPKAGTTSLADYLGRHPDIFMSAFKEPHFFSRVRPSPRYRPFIRSITEESEYRRLFARSGDAALVGEASTSYFWDAEAARRIARASPDARFVILLRDPVERAHSHYLNDVREGMESRSFAQALDAELAEIGRPRAWGVDTLYVDCGFYAEGLRRYLDLFGRSRLRVLIFEELFADPAPHLDGLLSFLGVSAEPLRGLTLAVKNPYARPRGAWAAKILGSATLRRLGRRIAPSGGRALMRRLLLRSRPKPPLAASLRTRLEDLYAADIEACEELLERALPWAPGRAASS